MILNAEIFVIKKSGQDGARFPMTEVVCLIGRSSNCDIRIQLPTVELVQCRLEVTAEKEVFLHQLASQTATLINGRAVTTSQALHHKDVITIVDRSFRFEYPKGHRLRIDTPLNITQSPKKATPNKSTPKSAKNNSNASPRIVLSASKKNQQNDVSPGSKENGSPLATVNYADSSDFKTPSSRRKSLGQENVNDKSEKQLNIQPNSEIKSNSKSPKQSSSSEEWYTPKESARKVAFSDNGNKSSSSSTKKRSVKSTKKAVTLSAKSPFQEFPSELPSIGVSGKSLTPARRFLLAKQVEEFSVTPRSLKKEGRKTRTPQLKSQFWQKRKSGSKLDKEMPSNSPVKTNNALTVDEVQKSVQQITTPIADKTTPLLKSEEKIKRSGQNKVSSVKTKRSKSMGKVEAVKQSTRKTKSLSPAINNQKKKPSESIEILNKLTKKGNAATNNDTNSKSPSSASKKNSQQHKEEVYVIESPEIKAELKKQLAELKRKSLLVPENEEANITVDMTMTGGRKRKSTDAFVMPLSKRKRVSFGPHLSPETFDLWMPPSSPLKKGATPKRSDTPRPLARERFVIEEETDNENFGSPVQPSNNVITLTGNIARQSISPSVASHGETPLVTETPVHSNKASPASSITSSPAASKLNVTPLVTKTPTAVKKATPVSAVINSPVASKKSVTPSVTKTPVAIKKAFTPASVAKSPATSKQNVTPLVTKTPVAVKKAATPASAVIINSPAASKQNVTPSVTNTPVSANKPVIAGTSTNSTSKKKKNSPRIEMALLKSPSAAAFYGKNILSLNINTPVLDVQFVPASPASETESNKKASTKQTPGPVHLSENNLLKKTPANSHLAKSTLSTAKKTVQTPATSTIKKSARISSVIARKSGIKSVKKSVILFSDVLKRQGTETKKKLFSAKSLKKSAAKQPKVKKIAVTKTKTPAKRLAHLTTGHALSPSPIVIGRKTKKLTTNEQDDVESVNKEQEMISSLAEISSLYAQLPSTPSGPGEMAVSPWVATSSKKVTPSFSSSLLALNVVSMNDSVTPKTNKTKSVKRQSTGIKKNRQPESLIQSEKRKSVLTSSKSPQNARRRSLPVKLKDNDTMLLSLALPSNKESAKQAKTLSQIGEISNTESMEELVSSPKSLKKVSKQGKESTNSPQLDGLQRLLKTPKHKASRIKVSPKLSGIKRLMKTPKLKTDGINSPVLVDVKELLKTPKEKKIQNSKSLSENVPKLIETPKQNAEKKSSSVGSVNKLVKTPKSKSLSPQLDGLKELLKTPSEKITSTSKFGNQSEQKILKATKQDLINNSLALGGIKGLMKTPKQRLTKKSPSLDGIKRLVKTPKTKFTASPQFDGIKELLKTPNEQKIKIVKSPKSVELREALKTPKQLSENQSPALDGIEKLKKTPKEKKVKNVKSPNLVGVRELLKTPKQISVNQSPVLDGIKKLMKTPKEKKVKHVKTPNLVGVRELLKTPQQISVNQSPALDGIEKLMKTPKEKKVKNVKSPNLVGVRELLKTPNQMSASKSPALDGIKKLMKTPKEKKVKHVKTPNLVGVRELLKTPQQISVNQSPALDGIEKLMKTPKEKKVKNVKSPNLVGVRELLKTPNQMSASKSPALDGIKKLMKTPKEKKVKHVKTPNLVGVRELLKTPQQISVNQSPALDGIEKLMKTPKEKSLNKSPALDGIKRLMKTPKQKSLNESPALDGIKQLMQTPKDNSVSKKLSSRKNKRVTKSPKQKLINKSPAVDGIKRLMKTPKNKIVVASKSPNLSGLQDMFETPKEKRSLSAVLGGLENILQTPQLNTTEVAKQSEIKQPINVSAQKSTKKQSSTPNLVETKSVHNKKSPKLSRKTVVSRNVRKTLKASLSTTSSSVTDLTKLPHSPQKLIETKSQKRNISSSNKSSSEKKSVKSARVQNETFEMQPPIELATSTIPVKSQKSRKTVVKKTSTTEEIMKVSFPLASEEMQYPPTTTSSNKKSRKRKISNSLDEDSSGNKASVHLTTAPVLSVATVEVVTLTKRTTKQKSATRKVSDDNNSVFTSDEPSNVVNVQPVPNAKVKRDRLKTVHFDSSVIKSPFISSNVNQNSSASNLQTSVSDNSVINTRKGKKNVMEKQIAVSSEEIKVLKSSRKKPNVASNLPSEDSSKPNVIESVEILKPSRKRQKVDDVPIVNSTNKVSSVQSVSKEITALKPSSRRKKVNDVSTEESSVKVSSQQSVNDVEVSKPSSKRKRKIDALPSEEALKENSQQSIEAVEEIKVSKSSSRKKQEVNNIQKDKNSNKVSSAQVIVEEVSKPSSRKRQKVNDLPTEDATEKVSKETTILKPASRKRQKTDNILIEKSKVEEQMTVNIELNMNQTRQSRNKKQTSDNNNENTQIVPLSATKIIERKTKENVKQNSKQNKTDLKSPKKSQRSNKVESKPIHVNDKIQATANDISQKNEKQKKNSAKSQQTTSQLKEDKPVTPRVTRRRK